MEENKIKVVATKKACELLECNRQDFHRKYRPKLKVLKAENGFNTLYELRQIEAIVEQKRLKKENRLEKGTYVEVK
jgi:hypothetical protein